VAAAGTIAMASARKTVATIVALTGVAIGAAAGAFCAYQLYPAEMNDWEVRHLGAGVTIGLLVWFIVAIRSPGSATASILPVLTNPHPRRVFDAGWADEVRRMVAQFRATW